MINISNITSPLGRALGFATGTALGESRWRYSFSMVGLILLSLAVLIIFSPTRYFSAEATFVGYYIKDEKGKNVKLVSKREEEGKIRYGNSVFEEGEVKMKKKGGLDLSDLVDILKNPTFMFSTFTKASVSFIFDISHLFIKDYVQNVLGETNQLLLLSYYCLVSGIGHSVGRGIGGLIVTHAGGYEHKNSYKVISIFSFCL